MFLSYHCVCQASQIAVSWVISETLQITPEVDYPIDWSVFGRDLVRSASFHTGDMEALQGQAQSAAGASSSQVALTVLTGQDVRSADTDRAHLEANMAAALTLQSPQEYQRWLLTYVRYLTRSKISPALT